MHIDYYGVASLTILLELHNIGRNTDGKMAEQSKISFFRWVQKMKVLFRNNDILALFEVIFSVRNSDIIFVLIFIPLDKV